MVHLVVSDRHVAMETVEDFPSFPPGISFTLWLGEGRISVCEGISTSPAVVGVCEQLLGTTTQEASGLRPCLVPQLNLKPVSRYTSSSNLKRYSAAVRGILVVGGHITGGGARVFHVAVHIAFNSAGLFYSVVVRVELDGAMLPAFPPIREPSFSQRNQNTLGSNPRHHSTKFFRSRQWSLKFTSFALSMDTSRQPIKREIL